MVTKANRTRAQERIEKAKEVYGLAEAATDNLLQHLAKSPVSLLIFLGYGFACVALGVVIAP